MSDTSSSPTIAVPGSTHSLAQPAGPPPAAPEPNSMTGSLHNANAIVQTYGVNKVYGSLYAVNNINLAVPYNSIYGLIGPNGAGKTTLMTMIASLLKPSGGSVRVANFDPVYQGLEVRKTIGYMPDVLGVYKDHTAYEYLTFFADAYKIPKKEQATLIKTLLELVELSVKETAQVNSLSRGMKQRLSLARSLIHDPQVLILDEPASGLDPRARIEFRDLLKRLQTMGKTIIVSSHILSELQEVCSHIAIIEAGKLLAEGTPEHILSTTKGTANKKVKVTFLDGSTEDHEVSDTAAQAALLHSLVTSGREVVEFAEITTGLEDVFMSVTEGIVQ